MSEAVHSSEQALHSGQWLHSGAKHHLLAQADSRWWVQHAAPPATATEPEATRTLEDHLGEALEEGGAARKGGTGKSSGKSNGKGASPGSGSWLEQHLRQTVPRDLLSEAEELHSGEDEASACHPPAHCSDR